MLTTIAEACSADRQRLADRTQLRDAGLGNAALAEAIERGLLTRVRRRVYSPSPLPPRARHLVSGGAPDPAFLAHVRAALMSLGGTAIAGGRTAAVLWGFDMLVEPTLLDVVTSDSRRSEPPPGVRLRRARQAVAVHERFGGLAPVHVLTAAMTVLDCALTRPLREAVVIADSALRTKKVSREELEVLAARHRRDPRMRRFRRVLSLVDEDSGSVLESVLRLLLEQHGLRPESQVSLSDAEGKFIGRVDFLFREQRLVIECDGRRWHDPEDARERDRLRANKLERAAWRLLRVTWAEVVHDPDAVLRLVRDCLLPWPVAA